MTDIDLTSVTAVVTGSGGFFGGQLAHGLLSRGARVRAFLRYRSDGHLGQLAGLQGDPGLDLWWGDVRDEATLGPVLEGADVVFHLAALVSVPHSYTDPAGYVQTNVVGTVNVLREAQAARMRRIVVVSTSEVYGTAQTELIDEDHPLVAQSPYAATKIAAEKLCESFFHTYGTPVVVVRPFNLYGPGQSRRAVIPEIVAQALTGGPVYIGSRDTVRDFNYVPDTVDALIRLCTFDDAVGKVFNIGSGRPTSINDVIATVERILGRRLEMHTDPARVRPVGSEVRRLRADSTRLRTLIGPWACAPLAEGITQVVEQARRDATLGARLP
ncbi:MAG: GDP-mannose 4,6-dehydratase [Actinomycetota bacterium]|nr:GDP-mannose 4,6-dehydratase [Actinomycetota bacterium]